MPLKTPSDTAADNRAKLADYKMRLYRACSSLAGLSRHSGISEPTIWRAIKTGKAMPATIVALEKAMGEIEAQAVAA